MDDFFSDVKENSNNDEENIEITANIEYQLDKFSNDEYLKKQYIPENALFANEDIINKLKSFYINNIDIPLLINGHKGIGKKTCIFSLLTYIPCYLPTIKLEDKINNIKYFKVFDNDYPKLLYYENIYFLNLKILHNNTDILNNLQYLHKLSKTKNFDENEKKIIIISNIDMCNDESQRYLTFMIDKIYSHISFIFTSHTTQILANKIMSSCSIINFKPLNEEEFSKQFKLNFKKSFSNKENNNVILNNSIVKQFYNIYVSNNYNIGRTIAQIKYHIDIDGIDFLKDKNKTNSLLNIIAQKFIKKKLILSTVNSSLEIRKFIYILVSLNINLIIFVKEVIKQLYKSKLKQNIKLIINEEVNKLSKEIYDSNKEVIIIETFFYKIITIIYS
jgi:hypothetical protein